MAEAPENTVASYRAAEEIGVLEIETDVRISSDGQLLMLHDATLDRTAADAAGKDLGPVNELPWSVINSIDVGNGERVPTLAQMYEATTRAIQLEIKDPTTMDGLVDYFAAHPEHAARTMITGFSVEAITTAADRMPDIARGIITGNWIRVEEHPGGLDGLMKETGSSRIHVGWEGLTVEAVQRVHDAGFPIHGWPTREKADLQRALELGVDGTTSDDPRAMLVWMADAGVEPTPLPQRQATDSV